MLCSVYRQKSSFFFISKLDSVMCLGNLIEMTCYCVIWKLGFFDFCFLFLSYLQQWVCAVNCQVHRGASCFFSCVDGINGILQKGWLLKVCPVPHVLFQLQEEQTVYILFLCFMHSYLNPQGLYVAHVLGLICKMKKKKTNRKKSLHVSVCEFC